MVYIFKKNFALWLWSSFVEQVSLARVLSVYDLLSCQHSLPGRAWPRCNPSSWSFCSLQGNLTQDCFVIWKRERGSFSTPTISVKPARAHEPCVFCLCFFFSLSFFSPPKLLYFDIWNVIFKWAYLKGCRFNRFKPQFGLCGCVCDYIMQAFWTWVCETWAACMSALCKCVMWMFFVKRFSLILVYLCACNWKSKSSAGLLVCSSCWWRERSDALHAVSVWRLAH